MTWRFVPAAALMAIMLTSFSADAAFYSRLGGQAYYDDQLDITWATDTNILGTGKWGSRAAGASTLTIDGVSGWRLPNMDVNNDGTVEACSSGISQAACMDNEFGHINWYGGGSGAIYSNNPGPFTNVGPYGYWSSTLDPPFSAYQFNMGNGSFGPLGKPNLFRGWAVHDGDVNPSSLVDVSFDSPVINSGPLSFGLSALPAAPNVTFSLNDGTPAGGGVTSYGLGDVLTANLIFGDVIGPNNLTAFDMVVLADGSISTLSYTFAPFDTLSVSGGGIVLNSPLFISGTDIASGQAFSYTYANSTETFTPVPEPTSLLLLAVGGVSLVGRSRTRRLGGAER